MQYNRWLVTETPQLAPVSLDRVGEIQYVATKTDIVPKASPSLVGCILLFSIKYNIGTKKNHEKKNKLKFKKGTVNNIIERNKRNKYFIYLLY